MQNPIDPNKQNHSTKKVWQKPDFQILDYGSDINGKNHFATKEANVTGSGSKFYKNTRVLITASHVGPKSTFHS